MNDDAPLTDPSHARTAERWARFRFGVVGQLLAAPPAAGELHAQLRLLATQCWRHPVTGQPVRFGVSTIERWYYAARAARDPVQALARRPRSDQGTHPAICSQAAEWLSTQYRQHPSWTYQLHADNLAARLEADPASGSIPSYASVKRFLQAHGMIKRPRRGPARSPGARRAEARYEAREVRSYQSEYVNALWHLDFHHGSVRVLLANGQWAYPLLLGILDDHSRLGCHAQWYLAEGAEELVHGLSQAFQKRGLPRALMSDNGSAMIAAETRQGLERLGILHELTLPFSPYQNGKQETWWNQIEGRLLPMLEGVPDLTLAQLNEATLAWLEVEYHRRPHRELEGRTPLQGFLEGRDVGRPAPGADALREAFTAEITRTQRRSDGTLSLLGRRFEIPSRYRHFARVQVRYAAWDLSHVHLVDPLSGALLARLYPLDKARNAEGQRAPKPSLIDAPTAPPPSGMAPLLQQILRQYATTGLPPAYLPKDDLPPLPPNP
jgi:transposase InsO family protein